METDFLWLSVYDDLKRLQELKQRCKDAGATFYLEAKLKECELAIKAHEEYKNGNH